VTNKLRKELLNVLVTIRYKIDYGDEIIDRIIEVFKKAGWKSPEEVDIIISKVARILDEKRG
jgi:hypothetical protein